MWDFQPMRKKLYDGISGLARIICAVYIGYLSLLSIYEIADLTILARDVGSEWIPLRYFVTMIGFAMLVGQGIRGVIQLLSIAKPQWENKAVALVLDCAMVISAVVCCYGWADMVEYVVWMCEEPHIDIWFWSFVGLALLDAIVMWISIRKEKIQVFGPVNRLKIVHCLSFIIIPVLLVSLCCSIRDMIQDNENLQRVNESAQGGFDSFTLWDMDGNEYTEELFRGHKVTMVNVWATYCGPCIGEMPELDEISRSYDPADFQIIGITGDLYPVDEIDPELLETAAEIVESTGVTYPILIPSLDFQVDVLDKSMFAYPTTFFVNEKGEELRAVVGRRKKAAWIDIIEEVIAGEK